MDGSIRLCYQLANRFAGAAPAIQDTGVGGEVCEEALGDTVEAGIMPEIVFVLLAEGFGVDDSAAGGCGAWEVLVSHFCTL